MQGEYRDGKVRKMRKKIKVLDGFNCSGEVGAIITMYIDF